MTLLNNRITTYSQISTALACLSDNQLSDLLQESKPIHSGIGVKSVLMMIDNTPIFVKKIPLTDLERQPENRMSTANFFDLPLFYQYGIGSAGFGAWRELMTHIMTSNWVISAECENFPILYHWRILSLVKPKSINTEELDNLEKDVKYWENSPAIRKRLEAMNNASANILLFLEYIPQTLTQWLRDQLISSGDIADQAVLFVDDHIKKTNHFINTHNLLHFDAHFENILTDGKLLYFSDFGLALSSTFELSDIEIKFLNSHHNYDRSSTVTNFLHCIITHLFDCKNDNWIIKLRKYIDDKEKTLSPTIDYIIRQYAPIAFVMDEFYQKLQKNSKSTPYPANRLDQLLITHELL